MSFGKTGYRDGGNRGGHDRFKWEDVKEDKYRDYYLGHSLKAPVGRWQKGKDLQWYTKAGKRASTAEEAAEARRQEMEEVRRRDEELINEALGLAPKRHAVVETQLEQAEIKALLARGASERDRLDVERVEGLGAAPAARHEHIPHKTLVERELERMKKAQAEGRDFAYEDGAVRDVAASGDEAGHDREGGASEGGSGDDKKRRRKEEKKRKKEAKKEKKRQKKEAKREKKEKGNGAGGGESGGDDDRRRGRSGSRERGEGGDRRRGRSRSRSRSRSRNRDDSRDGGRRRRGRVGSASRSRSRDRSRDRGDAKRHRRGRSRSYSR